MSKLKRAFSCHCERSVAILLALALVLSLGIMAAPMAGTVEGQAGVTYYVNATTGDDGRSADEAKNPDTPWLTIQHAVDTVPAESTVNVAAGTYDEQVVIDKNLTLQGAGDTTMIKPSQATADAFQLFSRHETSGDTLAPIVVASGSGSTSVTIKDLKVDGSLFSSVPSGASYSAAVQYRNCSGTIDSVTVDGINIQHKGHGMWLSAWEHAATVEVTGCTISGYNWDGICADRLMSMLTVNVYNTTITGAGVTTPGSIPGPLQNTQNAIQFSRGVTGTISGNTISENMWEPEDYYGIGIMLYDTADVVVEGNRIWNCDSAVHIMWNDNSIVRNNVLTSNVVGGVTFEGTSNYNVITSNELSNNKYGIDHDSDTPGPHNEAHYNNIFGNTEYGVFSNPTYEIDATCNWWGDASGPSDQGPGTGDAVSTNVDYEPWLMEKDGAETTETDTDTGASASAATTNISAHATGGGSDTTVTVGEYAGEPTGVDPGFVVDGANFADVHVGGTTPTQLVVEIACPGADCSGMVMR